MLMMMQPAAALVMRLAQAAADHFSPLFSSGVGIKTIQDIPLMDLLCRQLAIAPEYVAQRIQTIFLNHRAVDRTEQVIVPADAVLALSAAMPGLVGATFRKGGVLSAFREDISHHADAPSKGGMQETVITLKLFNLVAEELGPHLLSQGVWVDGGALSPIVSRIAAAPSLPIETCQWNGRELSPDRLSDLEFPGGWIALSIVWVPPLPHA